MDPAGARELWHSLEAIHAVTYFSPESRAAMSALGLRGFWRGYFAARAAPLGAVAPGVVTATFFNFHPAMVRRAIPDAWTVAPPDAIVAARATAAAAAIRRLAPGADAIAAKVVDGLEGAVQRADGSGRALFAANRDVSVAEDRVGAMWQATTALREHRGDGHVAVLTEAGLDGCEAHVLFAAVEGIPAELLRSNRGWSEEEWDAAAGRLRARSLITTTSDATDAGRDLRTRLERRTDELAAAPYASAGDLTTLAALLRRLATAIVSAGEIPFPNPMGLPRPADVTPGRSA